MPFMRGTYKTPAEAINRSFSANHKAEVFEIKAEREINDEDIRAAQILDSLVNDVEEGYINCRGKAISRVIEDILIKALMYWGMEKMFIHDEYSIEPEPIEPEVEKESAVKKARETKSLLDKIKTLAHPESGNAPWIEVKGDSQEEKIRNITWELLNEYYSTNEIVIFNVPDTYIKLKVEFSFVTTTSSHRVRFIDTSGNQVPESDIKIDFNCWMPFEDWKAWLAKVTDSDLSWVSK